MEITKWRPLLESWRPFELFSQLRDEELERRMRRLWEDFGPSDFPAADVYETDAEFVVELEVPGFEEPELTVEVADHRLRVKGERKEEKKEETKAYRRQERLKKTFERIFELPPDVTADEAKASFKKGVLEVHVPKAPEKKVRKVAIDVSGKAA